MESLLDEVKELEKKYEWLQAAELYGEAVSFLIDEQSIKATEFLEKMGFSFYKAAMQAPNNTKFVRRMKLAIETYEKESGLLKKIGKMSSHVLALIAYTRSCLENNPSKKKKLLAEWWNFEKQAKEEFENIGDLQSVGRICVNLVEYSSYDWFWSSSSFSEARNIYEECLKLAERAIQILSKLDDRSELARAYCFASWYYSFCGWFWESEEEIVPYAKKAKDYSKKALELAQRIGDAWLISQSYINIWNVTNSLNANPNLAINPGNKILRFGEITKDNWCMGWGHVLTAYSNILAAEQMEDPDKQKQNYEKSMKMAQEANKLFQRINSVHELHICSVIHTLAFRFLVNLETDQKKKISMFETLTRLIQEKKEFFINREIIISAFSHQLSINFLQLAKTEIETEKKRNLLLQAKSFAEKQIIFSSEMQPFNCVNQSGHYFQLASVLRELAGIELNKQNKIDVLNQAADSMRRCLEQIQKRKKIFQKSAWANGYFFGRYHDHLGKILHEIYLLTKNKKTLIEGVETYKKTIFFMKKAGLPTHLAESYWHLAQFYDQSREFTEASKSYESSSQAYDLASKKIPQLKDFYKDHSLYMQAWSQIEQARYSHSIEEYKEARQHYEKAAELHESTSSWNYLTHNYFAWANMEKAEGLSRKESTQHAKQAFQKAYTQFCNSEESFKQKLKETTSPDEKQMTQRLFEASELRRRYCQARILMEEAKLLDREGKYLQSSKSYQKAAQNISSIIERINIEVERNELAYIVILCRAWGKMANAEETSSSESYLEAAELFEQAKDHCYTRKASLWAIGNSSFCKGLAAGTRYQDSMDLKENASAKRHMKRAATSYQQAGFNNASEYAKATQRLFDAYVFMNQAESEVDPEKKAKQFQMAENLLQIAAGSFMKAKQPEKTAQVQEILANVREEKTLAISLSQVMQAPFIASTTRSFTAPTPTSEASVGLENFEHANVQANLISTLKEIKIGESFSLSVEFVNAGREPALLMRVEEFVPQGFVVVKKPEIYRLEDTCLNMKGKQIAPLKLVEAKLVLQPSKKGKYQLNPKVYYLDERGQNKILQLKTLEIKVEEVILEDRFSTGTKELDSLLLGGIPEEYAVVLSGPPCDERENIITNFLRAGVEEGISFYVTTEANDLQDLLENPNFFLFLCNPKPKVEVPDLPNVYRLQGKTDLNNLGIALVKAFRSLDQKLGQPKRICVEILSEVLEDFGSKTTRKWISDLITNYGAKGFTMLAVMYPEMHNSEESKAVLSLFDGEISITISGDPLECKKSILVKKLRNQDYIKNPICLTNK